MEKITSKNNTIIKDTKKVFSSSKARYENHLFALEGARLCFDVLNSVYGVDTLLYTEEIYSKYKDEIDSLIAIADKTYVIGQDVAERLSETKNPQGVFVLAKMIDVDVELGGKKLVALDNVQDPANVGAIIRSGEALGIDGIIVYNCCDIYNPKAIRASMGSVLRMSIKQTDDLESTLLDMKKKGYKVYSTVPSDKATRITDIDFSQQAICVIGNEANGVEENIKQVSDDLITIPMLGRAESLNASVAASITMWEMLR